MKRRIIVGSILGWAAFAACEGAPASRGAAVRDSAGIRIVENTIGDEICAVAGTPELDLGLVEGPSEYQFFRVFDAATLSDGRIAVVNQGSDQVRVFSADGVFERAFGAQGGGPGEFNRVFQLWVGVGDTLIVGDYDPWRFSVFTPEGEFIRAVVPEPMYANSPNTVGLMLDGSYIISQRSGGFPETEDEWDQGMLDVVRHAADGSLMDTLAALPNGMQGWLDFETRFAGSPVFESRGHIAAAGARMIVGAGSEPELRVYELLPGDPTERGGETAGLDVTRPTGLIRWPDDDRTVTGAHIEEFRRAERERWGEVDIPQMRRALEASVSDERPVADRFPAHTTVRLGLEGDVWVRGYARPFEEDPGWLVFDDEGRFQCRATLPFEATWEVYEIGAEYVLGKIEDDLGVEHVMRFGLTRP